MEKKGFELSMNVIIIAAIALIVLVVVLMIFMGKVRTVNSDLDSCTSKQGSCDHGSGTTCEVGYAKISGTCANSNPCCISVIAS